MALATERIAANLASIRQRIDEAARKAGRPADQVTLVAITKYVDADAARSLVPLGCADLGESRPQELWSKAAVLDDLSIRWHHVGHLQTNKLARTLPLIHLLQSVDSQHLLEAIDQQARRLGRTTDILIEVNISGDQGKHGFQPTDVAETVRSTDRYPNVRLQGLMAMGSLAGGLDQARRDFEALRILRDGWRGDCPPTASLDQLSMGMSGDFEVAIEEGATIVRIGTALFE